MPAPQLPRPRGPISSALIEALFNADEVPDPWLLSIADVDDPIADDDFQLSLYLCYELHYRGFDGVDDGREWDPSVLRLRRDLEHRFVQALEALEPRVETRSVDLAAMIDAFDGPSLSTYLADDGTFEEFREFLIHRSAYQLKEADPHSWGIPRLGGGAKAALVEIQMDEYGNGEPGQAHAELFADTLDAAGLDSTYGAYLDRLPGITLATTNLISLFGLHRRFLPALLGHLAVFEMTSVTPMGRYARAARRFGLGDAGARFYDVHVEADEVHQVIAEKAMVGALVADDPDAAGLVRWGAAVLMAVEDRLARHLLDSWAAGRSSLRPDEARGPSSADNHTVIRLDEPELTLATG